MSDNPVDPFDHRVGCTCVGIARKLELELNGEDPSLCAVHDADAIRARDTEKQRAKAEQELALGYATQQRISDDQAERRDAKERTERETAEAAAMSEMDPLVATLHRVSGAPIPITSAPSARDQIGIGDDEAFRRILSDLCGGVTSHIDDDGPQAA